MRTASRGARSVNVVGMRRGGIDSASARRCGRVPSALPLRHGSGAAIKHVKRELGGHPLVARLVEFVEGSKRA